MQKLFEYCKDQFFTSVFRDVVLIIALFISIKNSKKFEILRYFPIYIASLLLVYMFQYVLRILKDFQHPIKSLIGIAEYMDFFFTLLEMIIVSHFYFSLVNNRIAKKLIILLNLLFLFFFIYMATQDREFYQGISDETQSTVYTVEAIILFVFCSLYFIELFKNLTVIHLRNEPAFWISAGILFFMACTLPYSLLENHIFRNYREYSLMSYSIFNIFYALLFLMIIRAYLCKPGKTI
jgi:hypothetical protein